VAKLEEIQQRKIKESLKVIIIRLHRYI